MRDECEHGHLRRSCEVCELRAEAEEQSRLIEKQASEIARLRQRIESAPVGEIVCGRANSFGGYHVEIAHDVSWVKGKRVRLVVEDGE